MPSSTLYKLLCQITDGIKPFRNLKGENKLANDVATFLKLEILEGKQFVFTHIPNETKDLQSLTIKKALGMIAGAPDLILVSPYHTAFVELKTPSGKQSPNQKLFQQWCLTNNINYFVANSVDDVKVIVSLITKE